MGRRTLSQDEIDKVVTLHRAGASWLRIQRETRIHRRTAKHAYEKWDRSKSVEELREARRDVAATEFRTHMDSLIRLATSLVTNLGVPSSFIGLATNSENFFSWLWGQDLLWRYVSTEAQTVVYSMGNVQRFPPVDLHSYRREKELLFDSLKVHTREELRWENILDSCWKEARDNCASIVHRLQKETSQLVNDYLNQETQKNFLQSIKKEGRENDPTKKMVEAALSEIWRLVLEDKLDEESPRFQTILRGTGVPREINVKSRDETIFTFFGDANKDLAEKVARIFELTTNNLRKGDLAGHLRNEVRNMERATEELREILNPVRLRPMILRTRCDLCPA